MADAPLPDIPEGLEHLLPLFVAEMDKDAGQLCGLAAGDLEQLADFAHGMRGKAAMFGEQVLYGLLTRIEDAAMRGQVDGMSTLIAQVVERVGQLQVYGTIAVQGPT
jgi:HPt (histidine-containing phosphotransfer) domain-containing protein